MAQLPSVETVLYSSPGSWVQGSPWDYCLLFPTEGRPPSLQTHYLFMPASGRKMCADDFKYSRDFEWHKGPIQKTHVCKHSPTKEEAYRIVFTKTKSLS